MSNPGSSTKAFQTCLQAEVILMLQACPQVGRVRVVHAYTRTLHSPTTVSGPFIG
jgi:hypothetical protein